MLGVWDLAGLEARDWGFSVVFLVFVRGFFFCSLFFLLFWCPFCILRVCFGAPLRFLCYFIIYLSKKKNNIRLGARNPPLGKDTKLGQ
jgi:hypothetical protein